MNFSSHSPICSELASSSVSVPEWHPNFLTSEMSVALISVAIVNLLVSPLTIFLNVLVILSVKTKPQLRDKYNVKFCWRVWQELILRLVRWDNHSSLLN